MTPARPSLQGQMNDDGNLWSTARAPTDNAPIRNNGLGHMMGKSKHERQQQQATSKPSKQKQKQKQKQGHDVWKAPLPALVAAQLASNPLERRRDRSRNEMK